MSKTWVGGDSGNETDSSVAANWSGGVPGSGDEVIIPNTTHECQLVTSYTWGSLEIEAGGEIDGNGKTITLDDGGVAAVFSNVGIITGILDIKCNGSTGRNIYNNGTGKIRNLEIDRTGVVFTLTFTLRLDGTLTITTDSELDTGANRLLSVTGTTTIDGTLTANSSAVTFMDDVTCAGEYSATDGTTVLYGNWRSAASRITHNGGTFKWATTAADGATIATNGNATATLGLNNVEISGSGITVTPNEWNLSIYGDLTITLGELDTHGPSGGGTDFELTVTGAVDLADNTTLTCNASVCEFGSVQIGSSGANLDGSSTTTTITSTGAGGDGAKSWINLRGDNGFTPNSGKVIFTPAANTTIKENTFHDLEINADTSAREYSWRDINADTLTIAGDLTVKEGIFKRVTVADTLTVTGDVTIESGGQIGYSNDETGATNFGSLTIEGGGTYKATKGVTKMSAGGTFNDAGTYTHNNGTFAVEVGTVYVQGTSETAFYDVASAAGSGIGSMAIYTDKIIEHDCSEGAGTEMQIKLNAAGQKLTFGTDSYASDVDVTYLDGTDALTQYIYSANELFPAVIPSTCSYPRFMGIAGQAGYMPLNAHIKWLDIQKDLSLPETAKKLILDGDCSFADVTVGENNTLDLNGQRAEFSGILSSSGEIDCGTNALVVADSVSTSHSTAGNMNLIETGDGHTHTLTSSTITNWMLNGGTIGSSSHGHIADNIIVGAGKLDVLSNPASATPLVNVTTATGAELDGNTHTIPLSGDFTTAGGLIGKTGIYNDGIYNAQFAAAADQNPIYGSGHNFTVEGWWKFDSFGYQVLARSSNTGQWMLLNENGGDNLAFAFSDFAGGTLSLSAPTWTDLGIVANSWVHIAGVCDGTSQKVYINGKLVAEGTKGLGVGNGTGMWAIGSNPNSTAYVFDGHNHMLRMWREARTVTELRANMFTTTPEDDNTKLTANINYVTGGSGGTITDAEGNGDGVMYKTGHVTTTDAAAWAAAGTFAGGASTLNFNKAGTQYFNYLNSEYISGINVANGSTTILNDIDANNHPIYVSGNFVVSGTLDNTSAEYCRFGSDFVSNGSSFDVANGTITGIASFVDDTSSPLSITAGTYPTWDVYYGALSLSDDVTLNGGIRLIKASSTNPELRLNGNTCTVKEYVVLRDDAILNIGNGTLHYDHAAGSGILTDGWTGQTLKAGPGATIKGHSSASKTVFESKPNFEIVGNIQNLNVTTNELVVAGSVTDCTGDIIQWHHSYDYDQRLDTDTADDRDLRLGGPALDNANHLVT